MKQEETTPVAESPAIGQSGKPEPLIIDMEFLAKRPLSKTSLMEFRKSPAHYLHYLTAPKTLTPALIMGGLIDCLILTPELYEQRYVIKPAFDMRKTDDKLAFKQFEEKHGHKTFITSEMYATACNVRDAVLTNPKSSDYIHQMTTVQRQIKWEDKATGLPHIGYTDMDCNEPDMVGEFKTANNAGPDDFMRDAYKYGYHLQGAMYLEGFRKSMYRFPKLVFIVAEKEPPYGVAVYDKITPDFLKLGLQEVNKLRAEFKHCMENGLFHQSYDYRTVDGGLILDLPGWAKQRIED